MYRRTFLKTAMAAAGCAGGPGSGATDGGGGANVPYVEVHSEELFRYLDPDEPVDILARGFAWAEGPTWDMRRSCLYFSDIPNNHIYRWSRAGGLKLWRQQAGSGRAAAGVMPGTNGLLYVAESDSLLICDQDSRSILALELATGKGEPLIVGDPAFNSPNDLVRAGDGTIYFTDPTAGLLGGDSSPLRARSYAGVYRWDPTGELVLIDGSLTFPNGVALSSDERFLYVSVSDAANPLIVRYDLSAPGSVATPFCKMHALAASGAPGMPDGMAVTTDGAIFATAPRGIFIIDASGRPLGRIVTNAPAGNCCFGERGRSLFITANDRLLRLKTRVPGMGFGPSALYPPAGGPNRPPAL